MSTQRQVAMVQERLMKEAENEAAQRQELEKLNHQTQVDAIQKKIKEAQRRALAKGERAQAVKNEEAAQLALKEELDRVKEAPPVGEKYEFSNGDIYVGEWKGGKMHGKGRYTSQKNQLEYEGEWFEGVRNGQGTLTNFVSGSKYTGMWLAGNRHGHGVLKEKCGTYTGPFVKNVMCGHGKYTFEDGAVYDGEFLDDDFHGKGCLTTAHGDVIQGTWEAGTQVGEGQLTTKNGHVYKGGFKDDKKEGHGVYTAPEFSYTGEFHDNMMHGNGKYVYDTNDSYDGEWMFDKEHGHGVYEFADGGSYDGLWHEGVRNGLGTFKGTNGDVYVGEWKNDKKWGTGKYTFCSGASYDGEWENDVMHGKGQYAYSSGKIFNVRYTQGRCEEKVETTNAATARPLLTPERAGSPRTIPPYSPFVGEYPPWMLALPIDDEVRGLLAKEKITEEAFLLLEEPDLRELGLPIGPRKLLLKEIAKKRSS